MVYCHRFLEYFEGMTKRFSKKIFRLLTKAQFLCCCQNFRCSLAILASSATQFWRALNLDFFQSLSSCRLCLQSGDFLRKSYTCYIVLYFTIKQPKNSRLINLNNMKITKFGVEPFFMQR
jgi:hypothetical protein